MKRLESTGKPQLTLLDGCIFTAFLGCVLSAPYPFLGQKMTTWGVIFYCLVQLSRWAIFDFGVSMKAFSFLSILRDISTLLLAVGYGLLFSGSTMPSLLCATLGSAGYFISRAMSCAASQSRRAKASNSPRGMQ